MFVNIAVHYYIFERTQKCFNVQQYLLLKTGDDIKLLRQVVTIEYIDVCRLMYLVDTNVDGLFMEVSGKIKTSMMVISNHF